VPNRGDAYYYKPRARGAKPILMYLHGRGGNPAEDSRKWARVGTQIGWVVCPSGPQTSESGGRSSGNGAAYAHQIVDDDATKARLSVVHDAVTATCVAAERGVMIALEGDCKTPLGAHAVKEGSTLWIRAFVSNPDGSNLRRGEEKSAFPATEDEAAKLGLALGKRLH
jgi:hypothetical protein